MTKLQEKNLAIFKVVKKICDENNIRYFAIAGTAIGAVRHGGYIPWDDDIDIAMPRKDCARFIEIAGQYLPEKYRLIISSKEPKSADLILRIDDTTTAQIDKNLEPNTNLYRGTTIDIMPLDAVPNNYLLYRLHVVVLELLFRMARYRGHGKHFIPSKTAGRRFVKRIAHSFSMILPRKFYVSMYEWLAGLYQFDSKRSKYLARTWAFGTHDGMRNLARYHKEDFSAYIEMPFEDTAIRMPVGYDRYLSSLYPNYMTPPPKEKQKPHHADGILDMERSFKYYIAKKQGKKIGYTAGCYDMFHIGHLNILRRAKKQCDYLIVGINSDKLMYSYKGKCPIIPEAERMEIVREMPYVDDVVLVDIQDKMAAYKKHGYDVIFVGSDHKGEAKWAKLERDLERKNAKVIYLPHTDGVSSTQIREKAGKNADRKAS